MFHLRSNSRSRHSLGPSRRVWLLAIVLLVAVPRLAFAADEAPKSWHANLNLKQLFDAGGVVGVILAALSVAMVALVIEHLFSLRNRALNPRKLAEQVHQLMHERQFKIAAKLCRDDGSLLGFVLAAGSDGSRRGIRAGRKGDGRRLRLNTRRGCTARSTPFR